MCPLSLSLSLSPYEIICFKRVFMCLWFWACALFSECNVSQVVWLRGAPQTSEVGGEGTPQQALSPSPLQMGTEETTPHSGAGAGGEGGGVD